MILPNKNIKLSQSLLGVGYLILSELKTPETVSSLWEKLKQKEEISIFEKFVMALDLLYLLDAITINNGLLEKNDKSSKKF